MLENVKGATVKHLVLQTIALVSHVFTDEFDIYGRMTQWNNAHSSVCHRGGEYVRDEEGDGHSEVKVNTIEGFWSVLHSWLWPHRGISQGRPIPLLGIL
jgi:hypothetical protein